ncbi:hypothetical protein [Granulicoccus phenolivorans]|uniref:hypothetical protein n=1 Tax=Granulicoccus phenolivorans TaxID=266854 RepID=UPI0004080223|nr:hypothetical protein [Granulicoccus phenolivorans]
MRSFDYTSLKQRENKLWEFGGIAIPGGLSTIRAGIAGGVFVAGAALVAIIGQLAKAPLLTVGGMVLAAIVAVLAYVWAGRPSSDRMTLPQQAAVFADYVFSQPRRISGFSRDVEPDRIHWQAIVWEPTDADWWTTHDVYARHYLQRAIAEQEASGWAWPGTAGRR